ncbi:hypothetical protein OE88DRAFT_345914 [Heliocybe sulcata]|uniref:Uncharacterized protein n=1 Tax=Heliocybe sulcata TaxID=5364 RepID=A0A5C3MXB2_9AGAM|nr:hypothetical protein OE88DRAFT_345914 [Heliocybe sulcata]
MISHVATFSFHSCFYIMCVHLFIAVIPCVPESSGFSTWRRWSLHCPTLRLVLYLRSFRPNSLRGAACRVYKRHLLIPHRPITQSNLGPRAPEPQRPILLLWTPRQRTSTLIPKMTRRRSAAVVVVAATRHAVAFPTASAKPCATASGASCKAWPALRTVAIWATSSVDLFVRTRQLLGPV